MRYFAVAICVLGLTNMLRGDEVTASPLDIVQKRMRALNAHNLDSFLSTYADGVRIFVYPQRPLGKGKSHIQKLFAPMIDDGKIHVKVTRTMTADSFVVVESTTVIGDRAEPGVSIYEVRDGLIQSVTFLRDNIRAKQVDAKSTGD